MNWRQFKAQPEGFKGIKGFKGGEIEGLKPLKPLKPAGVELKSAPTDEETLLDMVRATYAELDALRDWTDWRASLSIDDRQRIIELETRIDAAYAALDRKALTMALSDYNAAHVTATVTANSAKKSHL